MAGIAVPNRFDARGGAAERFARLHALASSLKSSSSPEPKTASIQAQAQLGRQSPSAVRGPLEADLATANEVDARGAFMATGTVLRTPRLFAAEARLLAQAALRVRAGAMGHAQIGRTLSADAAAAVDAEATASARADGALLATPTLVSAEGKASAEAAVHVQAGIVGAAKLGDGTSASAAASLEATAIAHAEAEGRATVSPRGLDVMGRSESEATARVRAEASGHAQVEQLLSTDARLAAEAVAGGLAKADGAVHFGVDQLGLLSFGIGGGAEASSGAWAKTETSGKASILGLVRVRVGGSAEALAGVGSGLNGNLSFKDGAITIGAGALAAMGIGGGASGSVTIGLGKLPGGILETVGSPILPLPGLLATSVVRGLRHLAGTKSPDPTQGQPDLSDFPRVVAANFTNGVTSVAEGTKQLAEQVAHAGVAVGKGVVQVGSTVVEGVGGFFGDLGKGVAHLFSH